MTRRLQSLRVVAAFSGWLLQVVRRECRRLGRRLFNLDPYDEEKMEAWLTTSTDQAVRLDLTAALESLPGQYREIILLRDFQELDHSRDRRADTTDGACHEKPAAPGAAARAGILVGVTEGASAGIPAPGITHHG